MPLGVGVSVSRHVAACGRVLREAGSRRACTPTAPTSRGSGTRSSAAIKRCHEVVHEMGAPRITTTIKCGTRTDRAQNMADKVRSVEEKL